MSAVKRCFINLAQVLIISNEKAVGQLLFSSKKEYWLVFHIIRNVEFGRSDQLVTVLA